MAKVAFSITEPLAQHLSTSGATEGLAIEELAQRTVLTGLLKLEIPGVGIRKRAEQAASPALQKLDQKRNAFLDKKNRERMERERLRALADQEKRNRESGEKIKALVDNMELSEVRILLAAISEKIGA